MESETRKKMRFNSNIYFSCSPLYLGEQHRKYAREYGNNGEEDEEERKKKILPEYTKTN